MPPQKELLPLLKEDEEESTPMVVVMDGRGGKVREDANRSEGMHKGAAAVMAKWPEYASSCIWIGVLIVLGVFLLAAMGVIIAYEGAHMPSCLSQYKEKEEALIQDCIIGDIPVEHIHLLAQKYPNRTIRIIIFKIKNDTDTYKNIESTKIFPYINETSHLNKTFSDSNVQYINTNPNEYFSKSILATVWRKLDKRSLLLSCRALAVWNQGGIAFDFVYYLSDVLAECKKRMEKHLHHTKFSCNATALTLPEIEDTFLTAPDGLMLSSPTPCHAFAWDLLFSARVGPHTAEDIVSSALETYCRGKKMDECHGIGIVKYC